MHPKGIPGVRLKFSRIAGQESRGIRSSLRSTSTTSGSRVWTMECLKLHTLGSTISRPRRALNEHGKHTGNWSLYVWAVVRESFKCRSSKSNDFQSRMPFKCRIALNVNFKCEQLKLFDLNREKQIPLAANHAAIEPVRSARCARDSRKSLEMRSPLRNLKIT